MFWGFGASVMYLCVGACGGCNEMRSDSAYDCVVGSTSLWKKCANSISGWKLYMGMSGGYAKSKKSAWNWEIGDFRRQLGFCTCCSMYTMVSRKSCVYDIRELYLLRWQEVEWLWSFRWSTGSGHSGWAWGSAVFGETWGSTLFVECTQWYPERVVSITLRELFMSRWQEVEWLWPFLTSPTNWNRLTIKTRTPSLPMVLICQTLHDQ